MNDIAERVLDLSSQGLCCSQILMQIIGLEVRGKENAELIKAMEGLGYGMYGQFSCGALSGAACALSLHSKSKAETVALCNRLTDWFKETYGGTECSDILGKGCPPTSKCTEIIMQTTEKCFELTEGEL